MITFLLRIAIVIVLFTVTKEISDTHFSGYLAGIIISVFLATTRPVPVEEKK
jgi:hypothetical protein